MTTKRKPYVRGMTPSWWKQSSFYKMYMLREITAIPALWFCIVLIYGVFCVRNGASGGIADFLIFLRNPIVLILNGISLAAAVLQTKAWFELTPKAVNIVTKSAQKVAPSVLVIAMWIITIVASLIILALVLR